MSSKEKQREWRKRNIEHVRAYDRQYRARTKNRLKKLDQAQRRKYGITLEEKRLMYVNQSGLCAACGKPLPEDFNKACTDHNHVTGRVRQLLHRDCNFALGYEEKEPGLLLKVLEYKKRWDAIEASEAV